MRCLVFENDEDAPEWTASSVVLRKTFSGEDEERNLL